MRTFTSVPVPAMQAPNLPINTPGDVITPTNYQPAYDGFTAFDYHGFMPFDYNRTTTNYMTPTTHGIPSAFVPANLLLAATATPHPVLYQDSPTARPATAPPTYAVPDEQTILGPTPRRPLTTSALLELQWRLNHAVGGENDYEDYHD
jgi:hypothetical protein